MATCGVNVGGKGRFTALIQSPRPLARLVAIARWIKITIRLARKACGALCANVFFASSTIVDALQRKGFQADLSEQRCSLRERL